MSETPVQKLQIQNFGQIRKVDIDFGDLTLLVGAQGTGKSVVLQWLKASLDGKHLIKWLKDAGEGQSKGTYIDGIFGFGMGHAWSENSEVRFEGKKINPDAFARVGKSSAENVFFIPAHRALLLSEGWAFPFAKISSETPIVARIFSHNLFQRFSSRESGNLFPLPKLLKEVYRERIDSAVFHGGTVGIEKNLLSNKIGLTVGKANLPFMTWTAGQREFTPLLLGLYHVLPSATIRKRKDIDFVVIEEPEMGLHPQAIVAFMLLVLDLLWRGYKVVISTHSPTLVNSVWMLRKLQEFKAPPVAICEGFGVKGSHTLIEVSKSVLGKKICTHLLKFEGTKVVSKDISSLDPAAEDEDIAGWGGLSGFSSDFGATIRKYRNMATP